MADFPLIPGYQIEKELGKGGMATVYLGVQEKLNRKVAIKVLEPLLLKDQNFTKRFLKEAETAANLHHANIIAVHDVGEAGGTFYIVMEFLAAGSLKDRIKQGPISPASALAVVKEMALALDYAHEKGFVHRDIKPDNILFREDGTSVLTDFGIAKAVDSTTKLTKTGLSLGTPHYMSVEQLRGIEIDGRTDFYSLGIVLFEMLTGKVPFDAADTIAVAVKHIQEPVPRLEPELDAWQPLVERLLAKDRELRCRNGRELAREIDRLSGREKSPSQPQAAIFDDSAAFQFARKINTKDAYLFFLESFPEGLHADEAQKLLHSLDISINRPEDMAEAAFHEASLKNTRDAYIAFIRQYPDSLRVPDTVDRLSALEMPAADVSQPSVHSPRPEKLSARRVAHMEANRQVGRGALSEPMAQGPHKVFTWEDDSWIGKRFPTALRNAFGFWEIEMVNGTILIYVPAGNFTMGSPAEAAKDELPQRNVWLDGYWISKYPVTFGQFDYFCGSTGLYSRGIINKRRNPNDGGWGRGDRPVIQVTNHEAVLYCNWMSEVTGSNFALPTEAEWEKAARGTDGRLYPWGKALPTCELARFCECERMTAVVTENQIGASPYGALHMAGNVWEWCLDFYDCSFYERAPLKNPRNDDHSFVRVLRGGSYNSIADELHCAERSFAQANVSSNDIGFRVTMNMK